MKTLEQYLLAVQKSGLALKSVPEALKTPDICIAAVQENGDALQFVPEAFKTPELCLAAVQLKTQDIFGLALKHVPTELKYDVGLAPVNWQHARQTRQRRPTP